MQVQASAEEINKFEPKDAVKDPAKSQAIPAEADKAGIKVRASQTLLDLSLKNREQADIISRIQNLEEMLKSSE